MIKKFALKCIPWEIVEASRGIVDLKLVGKGKAFMVLLLTMLAALFEGFGVAMLVPILDYVGSNGDVDALMQQSNMWSYITLAFSWVRMPVRLISLLVAALILILLRQLFIYAKTVYSTMMTQSAIAKLRKDGFRALLKADIAFYSNESVGDMVSSLIMETQRAGTAITFLFTLIGSVVLFLSYLVVLGMLNWGMTLLAAAVVAGMGLLIRAQMSYSAMLGKEITNHNNWFSTALIERLNGIRLIKLAVAEDRESAKFSEITDGLLFRNYRLARIGARISAWIDPLGVIGALGILFFASEVLHLPLSRVGIFLFIVMRLMPVAKLFYDSRRNLAGFISGLQRVRQLLDRATAALNIRGGDKKFIGLEKEIHFKDVTFSHRADASPALQNVILKIPAGKMTALVGRSGAGKSTLVDLIPRLRDPSHGEIFFDDFPCKAFDVGSLRGAIAFVPQEGTLLNASVAENILYAKPDANPEEVRWAAKQAHADGFIQRLPEKYETVIGDRGLRLSGGERQRLVLARALLQRAPIIILDEATSSLDSESEISIQRAIGNIQSQGKATLVVIAHRLSTVRHADQIIVLDKGKIVECGRESDLLHNAEWYADMLRMQSEGYRDQDLNAITR
ncbi:ABC transporter ATP-binding protein [Elusimicrobiota bacterium]